MIIAYLVFCLIVGVAMLFVAIEHLKAGREYRKMADELATIQFKKLREMLTQLEDK